MTSSQNLSLAEFRREALLDVLAEILLEQKKRELAQLSSEAEDADE